MIYAPTFVECEQCGGFWERRRISARICPVCVQHLRAAAQRAATTAAHLRAARKAAALFFTLAGLGVLVFSLWRLL